MPFPQNLPTFTPPPTRQLPSPPRDSYRAGAEVATLWKGAQTTSYKPSKTQQAYAILEKSIQQADGRPLPPSRRTRKTRRNRNHRQRPLENLHREQLGRASRAGRHLRRDAHPHVARQERPHQRAGLLPLRARHEGGEGPGRLQLRETSASRPRSIHPRTHPHRRRRLHPRAGRCRAAGMDRTPRGRRRQHPGQRKRKRRRLRRKSPRIPPSGQGKSTGDCGRQRFSSSASIKNPVFGTSFPEEAPVTGFLIRFLPPQVPKTAVSTAFPLIFPLPTHFPPYSCPIRKKNPTFVHAAHCCIRLKTKTI